MSLGSTFSVLVSLCSRRGRGDHTFLGKSKQMLNSCCLSTLCGPDQPRFEVCGNQSCVFSVFPVFFPYTLGSYIFSPSEVSSKWGGGGGSGWLWWWNYPQATEPGFRHLTPIYKMQSEAEDLEAMAAAKKAYPSWVWAASDTVIGQEEGHFFLSCGGFQGAFYCSRTC